MLQTLLDIVDMVPVAMENAKRSAAGKLLEEGGHVKRLDEFQFQVTPANTGKRAPAAKRDRIYNVLILPGVGSSCTCPDHKNRGGRVLCKHIHAALSLAHKEDTEKEAEANFVEDSVVAAMFRGAAEASRGAEEASGKTGAARSAYAAYRCMAGDEEGERGADRAVWQWGGTAAAAAPGGAALRIAKFDPSSCALCGGGPVTGHGTRHNQNYDTRRYKCGSCGKTFSGNVGFARLKASPEIVTQAVHMWLAGMSLPAVALWLEEFASIKVCHKTILNWAESEIGLIEEYADSVLTPRVSDMWRTDEMYYGIRGREQYAFWMIDDLTRYVLALQTAEHKGTSDVKPLFEHAAALASMDAPAILVSDKAANFHRAWHDLYRARNFMHRPTFHIQTIHATDTDYNNNLMERFNGWIRARTRAARGLKSIDSAMLRGLRVFHNFVRLHGGLGGITPAQAAGIDIERPNAAMTLAQNAAVHRLRRRT